MKKVFFVFLVIVNLGFSQDKFIVSNLKDITLDIGQVFKPESRVINSDGSEVECSRIIYYNKKGVFSSAKSITFDREKGTLKANEPGTHDVVAVCINSNGKRLTKTFNINVNYPKIKKVKLLNNQKNIYVGNYIKLIYEITDEFENKRVVDYWNYDKALRYFSNVEVDIKSNNERVKIC